METMKKWTIMALALMMVTTVEAQENKRLTKEIRKNMLDAYAYRTDISKEVLAQTKKWPEKYGILHGDWIENTNGKSITLKGEVILPQYDYTQLELFCDSFYVMKVGTRRGVVTRSGRQVVPFSYWKLSFRRINEGLIFGMQNNAGTGKVDVYSTQGQKVCELDNVQFMDAVYLENSNVVAVYTKRTNLKEEEEQLFFPDGTPVTAGNASEGAEHPAIPVANIDENNQYDDFSFQNNVWVRKFWDFFEKKKYYDALFCIGFYDSHDRQELCSDMSMPNFITFTSILDCYKKLGMYEPLVQMVQANTIDHRLPRGLLFNVDTKKVESTLELLYNGIEQEYLLGMVDDVNQLYSSSLAGYQASVERRQQSAQMWMSVMAASAQALTTTLDNMAKAEARNSRPSPSNRSAKGKTTGNKTTASVDTSSADDEEEKSEEPRKPRDTSHIDRKIKDLEESLRSAEIREAKEHDTMTVLHIQSLRNNIKDLKKYREEYLKD